ncbi:sigma-E processing peptidase SpoIIGA [Brevibacillus dissolubilis]|uniref:sigma-E processing peptidase SpoIIGA n=1 Tax=Brevibacillus dissolubilis TaxID=1844116 RepID=UPI0011171AB5|nr:sigma-E processing peptidase SpoIIGA [Brevibacillus dissolubilis]
MVVYLDIILLLNFAIDALLLWFTAYFRKLHIKWWRLAVASLFGSSYLAFFFLPSFAGMYQTFVKLLFSLVMLWIAFGFRRWLSFLQDLCIFYFVAFVFGGGVFGLQYMLSTQNEIVNGIIVTHNDGFGVGTKPTLIILAAGFAFVYVLSRKSYQAIQEPRKIEAFLVEMVVKVAGESVLCRGLVDTGNQLHEPITRTPVTVMEAHLFAHVIPPPILAIARDDVDKLSKLESLMETAPAEWQSRIRLIPFRSVSRGMDFLVAFKPDSVTVIQDGCRYHNEKVLIGLNPIALSSDGRYQAIVHPAMLQADAVVEPNQSFEQEG